MLNNFQKLLCLFCHFQLKPDPRSNLEIAAEQLLLLLFIYLFIFYNGTRQEFGQVIENISKSHYLDFFWLWIHTSHTDSVSQYHLLQSEMLFLNNRALGYW